MNKLAKALLVVLIIVFFLNGCTEPLSDGLPESNYYHSAGWKDNPQHGIDYLTNPPNCEACHGSNLQGGSSGISCYACHHGWSGTHGEEYAADPDNCKACHGEDLNGDGDQDRDCGACHHEDAVGQWQHGDYHTLPETDCADCHGVDFTGANTLVSCFSCHSAISAVDCGDCHTGPATSYTNSAHGNTSYGVDRSDTGYAIGDCTQCHDLPAGSTNDLLLFAPVNPTSLTDNFCFQCHKDEGSVQIGGITNYRYASTFGGYSTFHTSGIMGAFNQGSYHNLYDIWDFAKDNFSFFNDSSNPCVACHNPHLAKRNKEYPTDPSYTAISRPTDHNNLWGDSADNSEKMSKYLTYRPPYYDSTDTYEPGGPDMHDGSILPDYNSFCQDCHQYEVPSTQTTSMNPNTTSGYLTAIDWSSDGDMHGERPRIYDVDGTGNSRIGTIIAPYNVGTPASNYVLSCLDCHEPHGTVLVSAGRTSSYLLRKEANNNVVDGCGPSAENFCEMDFCGSCHTRDHCGGPQGCFQCHYHGALGNGGGWCGYWVGPVF